MVVLSLNGIWFLSWARLGKIKCLSHSFLKDYHLIQLLEYVQLVFSSVVTKKKLLILPCPKHDQRAGFDGFNALCF